MESSFSKFSKRQIRYFFTFLYFIPFIPVIFNALNVLYFNATSNDQCAWRDIPERYDAMVITDIVPGGVADEAGIKEGDILLRINSHSYDVRSPETNPMRYVNEIPRGGYATYTIERDGKQFDVQIKILKIFAIPFLASFLLGVGFLVVGYAVVMTRPDGFIQRLFGFYAILTMVQFSTTNLNFTGFEWLGIPTEIIIIIARIFGPSLFIIFFCYFPVSQYVNKVRTLFWIFFFVSLVYQSLLIFNFFFSLLPPNHLIFIILGFYNVACFVAGYIVFSVSYFRHVNQDRKKQLRPILIGAIITVAAFAYLLIVNNINPFLIFLNPTMLLPVLLMFTLPLTFGYSIFRYRLMDIDLIIRRGIVYGIVTFLLALVYFSVVFGIGTFVGEIFEHQGNQILSIISLVMIAFIFDPVKRRVQRWVDTIFYRDKDASHRALLEFSRILPLQMKTSDILNSVVETISSTLHIDRAAGVLLSGNGSRHLCFSKNVPDELCQYSTEPRGIISLISKQKEPVNATILLDDRHLHDVSDEELDKIRRSGIELIVPMMVKEKVIGFINTGRKLSQKPYSNDDIQILKTVANQAAIAVENARLYEKEKTLFKVEEELKLASEIQTQWIPKQHPGIKGFDIAGLTTPARVVGGDYFDYIALGEKGLAVCIGDVSGKGLPAALMMANVQAVLRSQAITNFNPDLCLKHTNKLIYDASTSEMFVTLFYGILDHKQKTLRYSNAGHNYPIMYRKGKGGRFLKKTDVVLGINKNASYSAQKLKFNTGDILLLYTDGITEAFNKNGELYDEERLMKIFLDSVDLSATDIIGRIMTDVNRFSSNDILDDMTLVAVKCLGKSS